MPLVQNDHMIEDLPADTPDEAFHIGILPGTLRSGHYVLKAHVLDPPAKEGAVDTVTITEEIPWCLVPGKRVDHLLCCPCRRGMGCDVEVHLSFP